MAALPSCLSMVNHVLRECGCPELVSLASATREGKVALEGLNDAHASVWERQRWDWQRYTFTVALVANQADYPLPSDFERIATPPRVGQTGNFATFQELSPEEWVIYAKGTGTNQIGSPLSYKVSGSSMTFWPAPSSDYVTTYPTISFEYFKELPTRKTTASGSDAWDAPAHFYDILISYGKAKLKQFLESADGSLDMRDFETGLKVHLNKYRMGRVPPTMKPMYPVIVES